MPVSRQRVVPFFNYSHFSPVPRRATSIFKDACAFILQSDVRQFETSLRLILPGMIGVANRTDALIIALRAAGTVPVTKSSFFTYLRGDGGLFSLPGQPRGGGLFG